MEVGEVRMKLTFYVEEPSMLKKVVYWLWGKGIYLFPLVLGLFHVVLFVIGYVLLVGAYAVESSRNWLEKVGNWLGIPYKRLEDSEWVSERLRNTLKSSGLCEIEKKEEVIDGKTKRIEQTVFPYTEISVDESNYYLMFQMIPGQTSDQWERKGDAFANALQGKLVGVKVENGWVEITVQHSMVKAAKYLKEDDKHSLVIGKGARGPIEWEFDTFPHMLVVGPTRQGKSTFMRSVFVQFPKDWDVRVLDGKAVEFSFLKQYGFETHVGYNWEEVFEGVWNEMNNRYKRMEEMGVVNYREMGLKPCFLVVDEYIAIAERLDKKGKEKLNQMVIDLSVKGAASGVFLVLMMQRPDSAFLPTVVRSNTLAKVVLGKGDSTTYEMMFENKDLKPLKRGNGYCQIGQEIEVFAYRNYSREEFERDLNRIRKREVV